jgi:multidrug efflux pump subunit AcrA (membrane-fusion protein)
VRREFEMFERLVWIVILGVVLSACGGGGSDSPKTPLAPAFHNVTLSWAANRESGVNSAGGGYTVSISGQSAPVNVPYVSGAAAAPTLKVVSLYTGTYTATVKAYAALDANGGSTGSTSASSVAMTITVP